MTLSTLLAACGGGSGGDSPSAPPTGNTPPVATTPPPTSTTPPPPQPDPIQEFQTSVPTPTYASGSHELAFFNAYNDFRGKLGLGLLAQNTKLDAANRNHVKYLMANKDIDFSAVDPKTGRPWFHLQDPGRTEFTGITELDRAKFAQYTGAYVGETGAYGNGQGAGVAFDNLVATVYHRSGLMLQPPREIGIALANDTQQTMVVTMAYESRGQLNLIDYFGVYPADKQTGVRLAAYIETPNPFPELAYADYNTRTSYPINVVSRFDTSLDVTTFTVTEAGQPTPLDARLMTSKSDPNKYLSVNTAFLIGKAPFKPATVYHVRFEGAVNGKPVTKAWSFTTAG